LGLFVDGIAMTLAYRFIVYGRVQGVGFRYFAVRAAARCGVAGTVRNLPDGSVEAFAEGLAEAVESFRHELSRGPTFGRVDHVRVEEAVPVGHTTFEVIY
jgi:acylphosphatase